MRQSLNIMSVLVSGKGPGIKNLFFYFYPDMIISMGIGIMMF